jgi:hypothetical protein
VKVTGVSEVVIAVSKVLTGRRIVGVPVTIPVRSVANPPAASSVTLYQYTPSASWSFTNPLDHMPSVTVFMLSGVEADTDVDVSADGRHITVTWNSPHSGYVTIT